MLLLVTCTSALLWAQFPAYADVHLKRFCLHEILCTENYNLWRPGLSVLTKTKIAENYTITTVECIHENIKNMSSIKQKYLMFNIFKPKTNCFII